MAIQRSRDNVSQTLDINLDPDRIHETSLDNSPHIVPGAQELLVSPSRSNLPVWKTY